MAAEADNAMSGATGRPDKGAIEHLATAECWRLLESGSFGRLAVDGLDGIPDVFPVNYTVHDGSVYIKSAPGSKLMAITVHPVAAFEIDGEDDGLHWSVVLRGAAHRLALDKEIRESGVKAVVSLSPTGKYHYLCVTPSSVSGRRFAANPSGAASPPNERTPPISPASATEWQPIESAAKMPDPDSLGLMRPVSIAHFPPR
jgi:nitroimidazol reductase NimA-like FMN-containing flavoprotein (pyridoxamine 5'-phosphate oxidase superfamily)